jgi:uncharacterized lipoprotein YajG
MKYLSILALVLLTGCASQSYKNSITDGVVETITGKDYSRNAARCMSIKDQCHSAEYAEWAQENGQIACACNE